MGAAEALGGLEQDRLRDAFGILVHLAVPEADNRPAFLCEETRAVLVVRRFDMLAAIDLDNQSRLSASEIGSIGVERKLTRKLGTIAGQQAPESPLLRRGLGAKRTGLSVRCLGTRRLFTSTLLADALRAPTPNPSLSGRGTSVGAAGGQAALIDRWDPPAR